MSKKHRRKHKTTYTADKQMEAKHGHGVSRISQRWLDSLSVPIELREFPLVLQDGRVIYVDGFDPHNRIVYEFLGDSYHGNPRCFKPDRLNRLVGKTYGELYSAWLHRRASIEACGYTVKAVWSSDYRPAKPSKPVKPLPIMTKQPTPTSRNIVTEDNLMSLLG